MIHLLWCTIRPQVFLNTYNYWMNMSDSNQSFKTYVCVNTNEDAELIKSKYPNMEIRVSDKPDRHGVAYPSYLLSSSLDVDPNDIVIFASDDFLPPKNWDKYVIEKLTGREGCLMVNDGYQSLDFSNMAEPVFSLPVMTFSALVKMNKIIYHPFYNHLCSDAEHYLNAKQLDLIIDERSQDRDFVFQHHHWSNGKRNADQNDQNYYTKFETDKEKWSIRKNLDVNERLIVSL